MEGAQGLGLPVVLLVRQRLQLRLRRDARQVREAADLQLPADRHGGRDARPEPLPARRRPRLPHLLELRPRRRDDRRLVLLPRPHRARPPGGLGGAEGARGPRARGRSRTSRASSQRFPNRELRSSSPSTRSATRFTAGCLRASESLSETSVRTSARILREAVVGRVVAELLVGGPAAAGVADRLARGVTGLAQLALDVGHPRGHRGVVAPWRRRGPRPDLAGAHLLVGRLDLLEAARRLGRAAVAIRVVELHEPPVRVVEVLGGHARLHPEHLVRVAAQATRWGYSLSSISR